MFDAGSSRYVDRFELGSVFGTGARLYVRNLPVILPISLVAFAPAFAVLAIHANEVFEFSLGPVLWRLDARLAASVAGGILLQAGLTPCVMNRLEGSDAGFGKDLAESIGSFLRFAHVGLVGGVLVLAGFLVFAVPGVALATVLWVAVPSAVVERHGLLAAFRRSVELTRGYRLRILALMLLMLVVGFVVGAVSMAVARIVGMGLVLPNVVLQSVGILVWGLLGSTAVVCYHDLRFLREGASGRSLARVFE